MLPRIFVTCKRRRLPPISGVVCSSCEAGSFELSEGAHTFMLEALAQPLAAAPAAEPLALRQVERAIGETLEHHAHVQLRAAA